MDCFYVAPHNVRGKSLTLDGDEHKHLTKVLRRKVGEHVVAVDGVGNTYEVEITALGPHATPCRILSSSFRNNEPDVTVTLAQTILKHPAKFDFLVEKTTELGVSQIIPMMTEQVISKSARVERWQHVALAAMKQSCRSVLPLISPLSRFDDVLSRSKEFELKLLPHEQTESSQFIGSVIERDEIAKSTLLLVGPEGGFTDDEVKKAMLHGFIPVSLGKRRLRAETAGIVATAYAVGNR
jgi:16S rRNA (uracil1498-N3)-methyltransferase